MGGVPGVQKRELGPSLSRSGVALSQNLIFFPAAVCSSSVHAERAYSHGVL